MSRPHPRTVDIEPERIGDPRRDVADRDGARHGGDMPAGAEGLHVGDDHAEHDGRHRGRVPLLSVPRSLRSVDLAVGLRAVRGLLVVAVVVTLVLAGRWAWAVRTAQSVPATDVVSETVAQAQPSPVPTAPLDAPSTDAAATTRAAAPADPPTPPRLLVHVTGQVGAPGVVQVQQGARVIDAVQAAGGFGPDADQTTLNLARLVVDGEQVWVGRPGESPPVSAGSPPRAGMPSLQGGASGADGGGPGGGAPPVLDLNTATQSDLESLPGVGPVTAGHILAWRDAHGRFTRVDELLEVNGIGERTLAQLEPLVVVGG